MLQQLGDHGLHLGHVGFDPPPLVPVRKEGEGHLDAGQRAAQLVAHVEQELVAGAEHLRDPPDHLVEGSGEGAELVPRPARNGDVELAFAQPRDPLVERAQGPQRAAQDQVRQEDDQRHHEVEHPQEVRVRPAHPAAELPIDQIGAAPGSGGDREVVAPAGPL